MLKDLSFESAAHLLSKLVSMGDSYYRYGDQLAERGFVAFQANLELIEGLARSRAELDLHRVIETERAKELFANPYDVCFELEGRNTYQTPYTSKHIQELQEKIGPTGNALRRALRESPPEERWRLEIDPCRQVWGQLSHEEKDIRRRSCRQEFRKLRELEIKSILKTPYSRLRKDNSETGNFAYEVLGRGLALFGFTANPKLSSKTARFFTKPLVDDWIINLTMINDSWGNLEGGFEMIDGVCHYDPKSAHFHMDLRRSKQKGLTHKKLAILPLKFAEMSPLGEFQYTSYMDLDELAVGMLGYTEFYGLLAADLEPRLVEGLTEL